jgi:type I restriction enzyme S subunit
VIGAEWIRVQLPSAWRVARIRDTTNIVNGFPFDSKTFSDGIGHPLVRIRDIFLDDTNVYVDAPEVAEATIDTGDILVGMDGDFNVARWRGGRAQLNQRVCCIRPHEEIDARFLSYLLPVPLKLINEFTYSTTVKHLSSFDIQKIHFPCPDSDIQREIADFLDVTIGEIDTLIEAKQRGLDRSAPLRPSGIDWLGDIPAHWASVPLRFLVSFMGGATPDTKKEEYWNGKIPWVSPKDMKRDFIADAEDHVSEQALANSALKMIDEGAVLIVVRGMILAHSFPTAINTVPVTINQDMKALRCDERISPRFLKAVLEGATQYLVDQADSSAHGTKKLETGVLGALGIPVPPLDEQEQIVARIAEERVKIDKLATATQRSINLLKERRSALIAAAVTGQIAIPEAA